MKQAFSLMMAACLAVSLLAGCGSSTATQEAPQQEAPAARKVMTIGDTTFNSENWEETVDPHRTYNGWACIRYKALCAGGCRCRKYGDCHCPDPPGRG